MNVIDVPVCGNSVEELVEESDDEPLVAIDEPDVF